MFSTLLFSIAVLFFLVMTNWIVPMEYRAKMVTNVLIGVLVFFWTLRFTGIT